MATTSRGERYLPVARLPSVRYAGQLARRGSVLTEDVPELLLHDAIESRGERYPPAERLFSRRSRMDLTRATEGVCSHEGDRVPIDRGRGGRARRGRAHLELQPAAESCRGHAEPIRDADGVHADADRVVRSERTNAAERSGHGRHHGPDRISVRVRAATDGVRDQRE